MTQKLRISPSVSNRALHKRRFFWVWHRRLGLISLLLVIILSVTGILLNHTETLRLDEKPLRNFLLLKLYGIEKPDIQSIALSQHWLSQVGSALYIDDKKLLTCKGKLIGAAANHDLIVAACRNELILLTTDFQLIERIGENYGLPNPITQFGLCDTTFCLRTEKNLFTLNFDQLQWTPLQPPTKAQTAVHAPLPSTLKTSSVALPPKLRETLVNNYLGNDISWERVILDLHSGRILGAVGVALMDLAAIALLVLGISGFWLWWSGPGKKRKTTKSN